MVCEFLSRPDPYTAEPSYALCGYVIQISLASCVGDNGDQQKGAAHDHKGNDSLYRHGITLSAGGSVKSFSQISLQPLA